MKKSIIIINLLLTFALVFFGCKKDQTVSSKVVDISYPVVLDTYVDDFYFSNVGSGGIYNLLPDTIGLLVDTAYGFTNGFGGLTGKDSLYITRKDVSDWGDTTYEGAITLDISAYNLANYKAGVSTTVIIVSELPLGTEGPTDISGTYLRGSAEINILRVFNGVYLISNTFGVDGYDFPHIVKNYNSSSNTDSIVSKAQANICGSFTKLVSPSADPGQTQGFYLENNYNPIISNFSPLTLQWKQYTFPDNDVESVTQTTICGNVNTRTFIRQED